MSSTIPEELQPHSHIPEQWSTQEIICENALTEICNLFLSGQYISDKTYLTNLHVFPRGSEGNTVGSIIGTARGGNGGVGGGGSVGVGGGSVDVGGGGDGGSSNANVFKDVATGGSSAKIGQSISAVQRGIGQNSAMDLRAQQSILLAKQSKWYDELNRAAARMSGLNRELVHSINRKRISERERRREELEEKTEDPSFDPEERVFRFIKKEYRSRNEMLRRLHKIFDKNRPEDPETRKEIDGILTLWTERVYVGEVIDIENKTWKEPRGGW